MLEMMKKTYEEMYRDAVAAEKNGSADAAEKKNVAAGYGKALADAKCYAMSGMSKEKASAWIQSINARIEEEILG